MKATVNGKGVLILLPKDEFEEYAIQQWQKEYYNLLTQDGFPPTISNCLEKIAIKEVERKKEKKTKKDKKGNKENVE